MGVPLVAADLVDGAQAEAHHVEWVERMTPITTPFDFRSTVAEVANGVDLSGKRAIVTGAAFGIAVETARAAPEAAVTLAVRNVDVGVFGVPGTGASRTVERPSG